MHLVRAVTQPPRAPSARRFDELLKVGVNVLVLGRALQGPISEALDEVACGEVFERGVQLDTAQPDLDDLLEPVSNLVARRFLEQDITALTREYGALLGRRHVYGQLALVTHDACRKFHADHVTVRLLCSYAGPGTQWVRNEDVVRANLARIDVGLDEANRSVLRHPGATQQCERGDIVLLKGEAFDGNRGSGAVHRSPPIADHALRGLVFKIDESPCGC